MRGLVMMASVVGGIEYGVLRVEGKSGPLIRDAGYRPRHPPHLDCRPRLFLDRKPVPDIQESILGKSKLWNRAFINWLRPSSCFARSTRWAWSVTWI